MFCLLACFLPSFLPSLSLHCLRGLACLSLFAWAWLGLLGYFCLHAWAVLLRFAWFGLVGLAWLGLLPCLGLLASLLYINGWRIRFCLVPCWSERSEAERGRSNSHGFLSSCWVALLYFCFLLHILQLIRASRSYAKTGSCWSNFSVFVDCLFLV